MKATLVILLAFCPTACVDGRNPYARVKMAATEDARVVQFDGAKVYVDGRSIDSI
jgi:hypothetical protein